MRNSSHTASYSHQSTNQSTKSTRNSFLKSIRTQTTLPTSIRELAICRVAAINRAWYEWDSHSPILESANVLSAAAIEYLKTQVPGDASTEHTPAGGDKAGKEVLFDEKHLAVLEYTDAMTKGCVVPKRVFDQLKALFSEREVVELTASVAAYNCVSRFLVALDVGEMADKYGVDMS